MRKKFLKLLRAAAVGAITLFGLTISTAEVSAEQAAAQHYRQLIESGKFYIEYQGNNALAFDGDRRVQYGKSNRVGDQTAFGHNVMIKDGSPVFAGIDVFSSMKDHKNKKLKIAALYQDGKYYQFISNGKALRANAKDVENYSNPDDTFNRSEGWQQVQMALSLPDWLEALTPNNPNLFMNSMLIQFGGYHAVSECVRSDVEQFDGEAHYVDRNGLSRRDVEGKGARTESETFYIDRYVVKLINSEGNVAYQNSYSLYYDGEGKLKYVKMETKNGVKLGWLISIEEFRAEIPSGFFDFPKGCKVYESDSGGMGELLGQPTLVEKH